MATAKLVIDVDLEGDSGSISTVEGVFEDSLPDIIGRIDPDVRVTAYLVVNEGEVEE